MTPRPKQIDEEILLMSLRIPVILKETLKNLAAENRRSLNQQIVWMLQQSVEDISAHALEEEQ